MYKLSFVKQGGILYESYRNEHIVLAGFLDFEFHACSPYLLAAVFSRSPILQTLEHMCKHCMIGTLLYC